MLGPTDFLPLTPALAAILWVEAIVYLGIGLFEIFDDYFARNPPWTERDGRPNGYLRLVAKSSRKFHAAICLVLGWIALNGILEQRVSRFEIETLFLSLAIVMSFVWSTKLPGRVGVLGIVLKPEFWLQIAMFAMFTPFIRPEVAGFCLVLNLWGIVFFLLRGRTASFVPFSTETLLRDTEDVLGEEGGRRLRRLMGRSAGAQADGPPPPNTAA
ncbi:MAG: hypothetical protein RL588_1843 [Pseudomonadota bacterium]